MHGATIKIITVYFFVFLQVMQTGKRHREYLGVK
jgi:hypothetical protein